MIVSVMFRCFVFLLLMASPALGQYQKRQIHIDDTVSQLNGGRTFYVVVKKTSPTAFLTDTYSEISDTVFAEKPSPEVVLSQVVWPGKTKSLKFDAPDDATLGIYLLVTNPTGDWKMLLNAPILHHYTLQLSEEGIVMGDTNADAGPIRMSVRPRPYPVRVVERPLTLYPEMVQGSVDLRYADAPEVFGAIDVGFGVRSSLEAGLSVAGGRYSTEGLEVAPTVTPGARLLLSESSAIETKLPLALNPLRVGITFGLPTRVYTGQRVLIEVGEDLMTFRLYNRVMNPLIAEQVDTASAKLRGLGRLFYQVTDGGYLGLRGGVETNAFNYSATAVPVGAQVGYSSAKGVDVEFTSAVVDALADRPIYVFSLGLRLRRGGD